MAVEVRGEPRSMTSCFLAKLTFSKIVFMHWDLQGKPVSSRPRLTNSDYDGFKKRPISVSIFEHIFMSSHTDHGFPLIVTSTKYQTIKLDFMEE